MVGGARPVAQFGGEGTGVKQRAVGLLDPTVHLGPPLVGVKRLAEQFGVARLVSEIPQCLGKVEGGAGVDRIPRQRRREQFAVPMPPSGAAAANRFDVDDDVCKPLAAALLGAGDVLVRRADVAPRNPAADHALVVELGVAGVYDVVGVGAQPVEGSRSRLQAPVRVQQQ